MRRRTFLQMLASIPAVFGFSKIKAADKPEHGKVELPIPSSMAQSAQRPVPTAGCFLMNRAHVCEITSEGETLIQHDMGTEVVRVQGSGAPAIPPVLACRVVDLNTIAVRVLWPEKPAVYIVTVASNAPLPWPAREHDPMNSWPDESSDGDRTIDEWGKGKNISFDEAKAQVLERERWQKVLGTDPKTFAAMTPDEVKSYVRSRMRMRKTDIAASDLLAMVKKGRTQTFEPKMCYPMRRA